MDQRPEWSGEPEAHALLTLVMRAGEAIVASTYPQVKERTPALPAHTEDRSGGEVALSGLLQATNAIQELLAQDEELREHLTRLPSLLGKGSTVPLLYEHLFPSPPPSPTPDEKGKALFTKTEVQRLRDLAYGISYQGIANGRNLSRRTVETQVTRIYQKLGVRSPIQAIAKATALGYLDLDAIRFVREGNVSWLRYHRVFENLLTAPPDPERSADLDRLQPLAAFGLFLLAACAAAARQVQGDLGHQPRRPGMLCQLDGEGRVVRSVLPQGIGQIRFLVVAPPRAARQGFVPGRLYAAHDYLPQYALNRGAISEFTPEGQLVRTFLGGTDARTRLAGPLSLAFHSDGRLLATSGMPADALLAFSAGGAQVNRFCEGLFNQICVAPEGCIYAVETTSINGVLRVFGPDGVLRRTIHPVRDERDPQPLLFGVAVTSTGRLFVTRGVGPSRVVDEYSGDGEFQRTFCLSDSNNGQFAVDARDRLLVPSAREGVLKIVSPAGEVLRRIDLRQSLVPIAVAGGEGGEIWVGGGAVAENGAAGGETRQ